MNPLAVMIVRAVLSVLFIGFFGFITLHVLDRDQDYATGVKDVLLFLMGALTTSVVNIVAFWFSSSQGSAEKTSVLRSFVNKGGP